MAVASLKHPWDNKMRLPDENGGKDRRATFDDVGGHNVTTKTILGARARQQVGVPHERWLATKSTSPMTGEALQHTHTFPNHALRRQIREWQEPRGALSGFARIFS